MIHRSWCVLFALWLAVPIVLAADIELVNPTEMDFAEFRIETRSTENVARKTPALNDRVLPTPPKKGTIKQVSAFDDDPFPMVAQPSAIAPPTAGFDWGTSVAQHYPPATQAQVFPYDAYGAGQMQPQFSLQDMQAIYLAQQQLAQQQFAQQQFAQAQLAQYQQPYQQQFQQGSMMPYANAYGNPQTDMYAQYGYVDPYESWANQMASPYGYQVEPNHSAMYQAFLMQETARRQAEEAKANGEKAVVDAKKQADAQWTYNNFVPVRITSPLGETLLLGAKTISPFSTPSGPDKGVGMPLVCKSWLDHPYYFGGFVGYMSGSELVSNMIEQKSGGTGGLTFGYNFNDYWGLESRLHFASIDIRDTDTARQLFEANYLEQFPGMLVPPLSTRTNELTIFDAAVHYYPLGNAKWRPYFKYGLGFGRQRFTNTFGYENTSDIITMPLGVGMRYWWNERIAIQADLHDNVIFASGIAKTQHNVAFTVGLTYAFGGSNRAYPVHYWPATPSMGSKW